MKSVRRSAWLALVLAWGCTQEKPAPPLASLAPPPLPALVAVGADGGAVGAAVDESLFQVAPAEVYGEPVPREALRMELAGEQVVVGGARLLPRSAQGSKRLAEQARERVVLLVPDADTFLAQVSELLEVLAAEAREVWLHHPEEPVAYRLLLRDEQGFQSWLAEVAPGKLRIIQRQDGFELTTSVGKLPGGDPNGPSVPVRGGRQDLALLREGLVRLARRFQQSEDICLVPSFGTEVAQAARALSAVYTAPGEPLFGTLCFVYPTPPRRQASTGP